MIQSSMDWIASQEQTNIITSVVHYHITFYLVNKAQRQYNDCLKRLFDCFIRIIILIYLGRVECGTTWAYTGKIMTVE